MSFAEDVRTILVGVRGAWTEALVDAGADAERPQAIAKRLAIHRNLGWKASRVATSRDVLEVLDHLPGGPGIELFLAALAKRAARPESVARLRDALVGLETFVAERAGDRATLGLMVSELLPRRAARERHEAARRAAFHGNRALWGVQSRLRFGCAIVAPSEEPGAPKGAVDLAFLGGILELMPLRPELPWPVFRMGQRLPGGALAVAHPVPIVPPPPESGGMPLLREFSSPTLPRFTTIEEGGMQTFQATFEGVGKAHALDCVYATVTRAGVVPDPTAPETESRHALGCLSPSEWLICDLLLSRELSISSPPVAELFSRAGGLLITDEDYRRNRLPLHEDVDRLGSPPSVATPIWPRYREALAFVADTLGWNLNGFEGYRVQVAVPPMPTTLRLRFSMRSPG